MCIAVASPAGSPVPTLEILRNCWDRNRDGAGFAFNYDGQVFIKKGFMTFESFISAFDSANKRFNFEECGLLVHFRIATHGGVCPEMCHPFPIVGDTGALRKLEYVSDYAVIHNGIISMTSSKATTERIVSDTAVFVRDYLTLIAQNRQWFKRRANIDLIDKLIDSKMAVLNGRGEIIHTTGFIEDGGILYSNESYKREIRKKNSYNYVYNYDYDYDDYDYNYNSRYYDNNYWNNYNQSNPYAYTNYQNKTSAYQAVPLMRCDVHDTISGDSIVDDYCTDYQHREYALSKEGYLYYLIPDDSESTAVTHYSLEFVGSGRFHDKMNKVKSFVPNFWPKKGQFLNESYPEALNDCEVAETEEDNKKKENVESVGVNGTNESSPDTVSDNHSVN